MAKARKEPTDGRESHLREALEQALQVQDRLWWMVAELLMQLTVVRGGDGDDLGAEIRTHFKQASLLSRVALKNFEKLTTPMEAEEKYALEKGANATAKLLTRILSLIQVGDVDTRQGPRHQLIVHAIVGASEDIRTGRIKKGRPISVVGSDRPDSITKKSVPIVMLNTDDDVARAAVQTRLLAVAETDIELWKRIFQSSNREDILVHLVAAVRAHGTRTVRSKKEAATLRDHLTEAGRRPTTKGRRLPPAWLGHAAEAIQLILGEAPPNPRSLEPR